MSNIPYGSATFPINVGGKNSEAYGRVWSTSSLSQKVPTPYRRFKNYSFANVSVRALVPFSIRGKASTVTEIELHNLSLIAISTHRDKYPVVSLGSRGIRGYTLGHRMVAGSLSFAMIGEGPFAPLLREYAAWLGNPYDSLNILPDELPPFDLQILFTDQGVGIDSINSGAYISIRGVQIIDSSRNVSTSDVVLGDTYSFMAESVTEFNDLSEFNINRTEIQIPTDSNTTKMQAVNSTKVMIPSTVVDILGGTGVSISTDPGTGGGPGGGPGTGPGTDPTGGGSGGGGGIVIAPVIEVVH